MKIDLHVHSKFSTRPSQWVLQKIGCPESFTDPVMLREIALNRGMSMVTITDHNTIDGALEIAHLPDVFISEEVTTYFPEDGCKIHVLALNITEQQHRDIQRVRSSIFDLTAFLAQEDIFHILAHPLYSTNDRLTVDHFEQLLLLFKHFELNGARDERQNSILTAIVGALTPMDMERLMEKHRIEPGFPEPWKKHLTAGSDDHSSLNIARKYTEVKGVQNLKGFLTGISTGQCRTQGIEATPLTLSYTLYSIAYQFYRTKFRLDRYVHKDLFMRFLDGFLGQNNQKSGLKSKIYLFLSAHRQPKTLQETASIEQFLRHETRNLILGDPAFLTIAKSNNAKPQDLDTKWFEFVRLISNKTLHHFLDRFLDHLSGANVFDIFSSLGSAGALYALVSPYFLSFSLFSRDRDIAEQVGSRFVQKRFTPFQDTGGINVAHFTDTFYEINGIAATLQQQLRIAKTTGKQLTVMTCEEQTHTPMDGVRRFKPIGIRDLPEYPEQKLFYPPFLDMLRFCYEGRFTHLHSATPGPIGLSALAIAHILNLPIVGTYHTSLPQYARYLTNDSAIEELMWKYVLWYYNQMDFVYVPSKSTGEELVLRGLSAHKIRLFPRGVDIRRFHPSKRDLPFLQQYINVDTFKLLYVGRVSKEKNLPMLAQVFRQISQSTDRVSLVVAGDGPYSAEMKRELAGTPCAFTGCVVGEELAKLYATCDLFVFPSTTDTFGNVVLEAQASQLPVVVTDAGGPHENMIPEKTGIVVPADNAKALIAALRSAMKDRPKLNQMRKAARQYAERRPFERAFEQTWQMYIEPDIAPSPFEERMAKAV